MQKLEGETIKEWIINRLNRYKDWLKPNPGDPLWKQSLKMIYKGLSVVLLIVFSPVLLILLLIIFFATL